MQLTSSDFIAGGPIPIRFTCEGDNISPEFSWMEVPRKTKSCALIIYDPDSPKAGGFTHWVLYNIPGDKGSLNPNVPKRSEVPGIGIQGTNDSGEIGYMGPCPPTGTHSKPVGGILHTPVKIDFPLDSANMLFTSR